MERPVYICQLPEAEQAEIREKLKKYMLMEGFTEEDYEEELQNAMDSKIDDIDWRMIHAIIND